MLHAGLIALHAGGLWRGVLLRGPSGVGKSDLALRAMAAGWRLVADDRVVVWRSGGRVWGRAPGALHGLIEARGQAVLSAPALAFAPIELVADLLGGDDDAPERIPPTTTADLASAAVRACVLRAADASAVARLRLALEASSPHAALVKL